jgi:hypothetical protein
MRSKFAIPALVMASFALSGTLAYAQTNPGGGTRATGYPTADKKVNETSDPPHSKTDEWTESHEEWLDGRHHRQLDASACYRSAH